MNDTKRCLAQGSRPDCCQGVSAQRIDQACCDCGEFLIDQLHNLDRLIVDLVFIEIYNNC